MNPTQEYIRRIYQGCLSVSGNRFRSWALGLLHELVLFDSAIWCKGDIGSGKIHSVTVSVLPDNYSASFDRMRKHNTTYKKALKNPGEVCELSGGAGAVTESEHDSKQLVQRLLQPFGISEQVGVYQTNSSPGSFTYMEFYKRSGGTAFTAEEKAEVSKLAPHLDGAATHAFFVHAAAPGAMHWKRAGCLCDGTGRLLESQVALTSLLVRHFPQWNRKACLPFAVPLLAKPAIISVGGLNVYVVPQADLFILRVWEKNPLEALSKREMEISVSVSQGLSYKAIGNKYSLSESTVANHMYRVFKKLGIGGRTQLSELVLAHRDSNQD